MADAGHLGGSPSGEPVRDLLVIEVALAVSQVENAEKSAVIPAETLHSAPRHPADFAIRTAQSAEAKEAEGSSGAPFSVFLISRQNDGARKTGGPIKERSTNSTASSRRRLAKGKAAVRDLPVKDVAKAHGVISARTAIRRMRKHSGRQRKRSPEGGPGPKNRRDRGKTQKA